MTRIALAHEWLNGRHGSEKTYEVMAHALPQADLYALSQNPDVDFDFGGRRVRTTFLDRPGVRERRELTLPLMPLAWRTLPVDGRYDVVLTSSHACVRAFPPCRVALHFSYTHAPMRYAWDPSVDQRTDRRIPGMAAALDVLRRMDLRWSRNVDFFAANSTAVRERIRRFYGRDAEVIPPPVEVGFFTLPERDPPRSGVLAFSRFIPYKKLDLAIRAAALVGVPVTVAGSGPEEQRLRALADECGARATFEIEPSDERLRELYRRSEAVLFPAVEDFGIVPVEAQACGTPVIGIDADGVRDTVIDGETGYRVAEQTAEALAVALERLRADRPDPRACRANAERFSREAFEKRLLDWMTANGADVQPRAAAA